MTSLHPFASVSAVRKMSQYREWIWFSKSCLPLLNCFCRDSCGQPTAWAPRAGWIFGNAVIPRNDWGFGGQVHFKLISVMVYAPCSLFPLPMIMFFTQLLTQLIMDCTNFHLIQSTVLLVTPTQINTSSYRYLHSIVVMYCLLMNAVTWPGILQCLLHYIIRWNAY